MKLVNMAKCGATISLNEKLNCESFVKEKLYQIPEDADYIIFKFGINDSFNISLGQTDDMDPHTFCGAWNTVLSYVKRNHPNAKVGVIASNYCKSVEWSEAVVRMCEKYNVPCLNEEGESVPYFYGQKFKPYPQYEKDRINASRCCNAKNFHPNIEAHKIESHLVERFLMAL